MNIQPTSTGFLASVFDKYTNNKKGYFKNDIFVVSCIKISITNPRFEFVLIISSVCAVQSHSNPKNTATPYVPS